MTPEKKWIKFISFYLDEVFGKPKTNYLTVYPDPDINQALWQLYQTLSEARETFPFGDCILASKKVADLDLVFKYRQGTFILDHPLFKSAKTCSWAHSWCDDDKGRIVDLTASMFNPALKKSNRLPTGLIVIEANHPLKQRYQYWSLWEKY